MSNPIEKVIYSVSDYDLPYTNLLFFLPFFIMLIVSVFVETKDFAMNVKTNTMQKNSVITFISKIAIALLVFGVISSGVGRLFVSANNYKDSLNSGAYNIIEGYIQNQELYISKDGEDGVEARFSINNIQFDTGFAYGPSNKLSEQDYEQICESCVVVKYIVADDNNIILELGIVKDNQSAQGTVP